MPTPIVGRQLSAMRLAGMDGLASAVELQCTQAMLKHQVAVAPIPVTAEVSPSAANRISQRSWPEQQWRNFKARRLKQQRRKRDLQNEQATKELQRLEALKAGLPQLNPAHAFETNEFSHLLATYLPQEPLPLLERPGVLYRGMALSTDGKAVKNILENGLRLKDLGSHATTKMLAMSGGMRGTVAEVRPVTNLTSIPSEALYWATQRIEENKKLLVIAVVNGQQGTGEVVLASEDIPAEQIAYLLVPLHLADGPHWYRVELAENSPYGPFRLTPYDLSPLAETPVAQP